MKTLINCENFRGLAIAESPDKVKIAQLRCKQWSCAYCAKQNALQWRASIIDYINKNGGNWSFWTMTVPSWVRKYPTENRYELSLSVVKHGWDKFMKRCKRYLGKFQYMRILESHKDGTIHVHFLAQVHCPIQRRIVRKDNSSYVIDPVIKKHGTDCGFGYICEHRNLVDTDGSDDENWSSGAVAVYCTKYITKDLAGNDKERKSRRIRKIQTSRGIKRVNVDSNDVWKLKSGVYLDEFVGDDRIFHDVTTGHVITNAHFKGGVVYPPETLKKE